MRLKVAAINCSFCGKGQDEILKIIASPNAFICNECIYLCYAILEEEMDTCNHEWQPHENNQGQWEICPKCKILRARCQEEPAP